MNHSSWEELASKELGEKTLSNLNKDGGAGISIKPLYTSADLQKYNYKETLPGIAPFTRGPRATMYTQRPWTIRQYAGFSTAEQSNTFYKQCLAAGQKGLSVAFDLATHRGYDSDHPRVAGDVGKAGVAIDSVEDMKRLFLDIPLSKMSVSMTMNGAVIPILAAYIVTAQEQGASLKELRGTIQNDILKEYMVRNTYIYPPKPSMRIVSDIMGYTSQQMPLFNSISISGYHIQEAGGDLATELAYTLADGLEYVKAAIARGLHVDDFAPRLSFFFGVGKDFFMEIAKLRAARTLWHELMSQFQPKNPKSSMLRTHCQTSGYTLTEQDPYNNIIRTTIEAMAATLGGTQSLHTNAMDEAIALPSEFAARIARNTQLILQEETDITATVDPFGGSYFMESLTLQLSEKVKKILAEINSYGGMTEAIIAGIPKMRIEEASAKKQALIDKGDEVIVGVNKYQIHDDQKVPIRTIDDHKVRQSQIDSLKRLKKERNETKVQQCLKRLEDCAESEHENILEWAIPAIKARATIGEVSLSLEKIFTRHQASSATVSNVYGASMQQDVSFLKATELVQLFREKEGRSPRILVAKMGQDGHDRGARVIATGLADIGFDVDLSPLFQTPNEIAKQAVDHDTHFIGISSQAGAHLTLIHELIQELNKMNAVNIPIVVGGVIPKHDTTSLLDMGVIGVFGPGSKIAQCAIDLIQHLHKEF